MSENTKPRILIVGAGALGLIIGYHLHLAGAEITFLIRPHRVEALSHTQLLYSYDDNKLKEFKEYTYITEPSKMIGAKYDYILITLDGIALQNETGQALTKIVGQAVSGTSTKVILVTVAFGIRSWFLKTSGIADDQLACGFLTLLAYSPKLASLELEPQVDRELVEKADMAYTDKISPSWFMEDNARDGSTEFMKLYNSSGAAPGVVLPESKIWVNGIPMFAGLAACDVLGWPKLKDVDEKGEVWKLATAAVKEIQSLDIYGEAGKQAASATTEAGILGAWTAFEKTAYPFNFQDFNRYHHGGKVNPQDREILRSCIAAGNAEGKTMKAVKDLLQRVEASH